MELTSDTAWVWLLPHWKHVKLHRRLRLWHLNRNNLDVKAKLKNVLHVTSVNSSSRDGKITISHCLSAAEAEVRKWYLPQSIIKSSLIFILGKRAIKCRPHRNQNQRLIALRLLKCWTWTWEGQILVTSESGNQLCDLQPVPASHPRLPLLCNFDNRGGGSHICQINNWAMGRLLYSCAVLCVFCLIVLLCFRVSGVIFCFPTF